MKKRLVIIIMGLFFTCSLIAQAPGDTLWTRTYGENNTYDSAECVQQTTDNGYVLAGVKVSFETFIYSMFVVKTDTNGDTLWTNTFGEGGINFAYSVQETSDNGFIISGLTATSFDDDPDYYLVKTDPLGDTLWTRTYGGTGIDISTSVQQTTDEGYIVAGYTESFGSSEDIYLVKTDLNGDTLWTRTYGGTDDDEASSIQQTTDGGYIIGGYTRTDDNPNCYLIKTDAIGDTIWTKTYIYGDISSITEVQQTNDNGFILTGWTSSGTGAEGFDWLLIKTDSYGDTLWTRTYGENEMYDVANSIQQTYDGGYIVAGFTSSGWQSGYNSMLIKINSYGDTLWTRIYGGECDDLFTSVKQTTDGGYIVAGATSSFGTDICDMWLLKIAGNGLPPLSPPQNLFVTEHGYASWDAPASRDLIGYNVYLDENFVEYTTDLFYQYTDLINGQTYLAGVSAVYEEGESEIVEIGFMYLGTGTKDDILSNKTELISNYPNPFNPTTTISFSLTAEDAKDAEIIIYNLKGQKVKTLIAFPNESLGTRDSVTWDGTDENNQPVSSGIYFYRLRSGRYTSTRKMILMK